MESKKAIYDLMPSALYPGTIYFTASTDAQSVISAVINRRFSYPLIAKPDIGGRGRGVKKIGNEMELIEYTENTKMDFLVQEFVDFKNEVGIFYYRLPNRTRGHVTGIVRKEFLSVTGDGRSTIREICRRRKRYLLQMDELQKEYGVALDEVMPAGEMRVLVPYGNHVRGAKFLDDSHLIDEDLVSVIDGVCQQVPGFFYGRLDIRYNTMEELKEGRNFSIIEMNGAGSEPTHMYDPKHTLFFAWKEIIKHWRILWQISRINHRLGVPYMTYAEGVGMFRENTRYEKLMNEQHV